MTYALPDEIGSALEALRSHADNHNGVANVLGRPGELTLEVSVRGKTVFDAPAEAEAFTAAHKLLDCGAFGSCA